MEEKIIEAGFYWHGYSNDIIEFINNCGICHSELKAKKPMNNYLCASCEAYIGDLKNKEEKANWNKLINRKNKKNLIALFIRIIITRIIIIIIKIKVL